jgi:4-hydroxy-tetrahydrodipicolinate synthase
MIHLARSGKGDEAMEIHNQIAPLVELIFQEGNPAGIKGLLEGRSLCSSFVRLPLVPPTSNLKRQIESFLKHQGLLQ